MLELFIAFRFFFWGAIEFLFSSKPTEAGLDPVHFDLWMWNFSSMMRSCTIKVKLSRAWNTKYDYIQLPVELSTCWHQTLFHSTNQSMSSIGRRKWWRQESSTSFTYLRTYVLLVCSHISNVKPNQSTNFCLGHGADFPEPELSPGTVAGAVDTGLKGTEGPCSRGWSGGYWVRGSWRSWDQGYRVVSSSLKVFRP